MQRVPLAHLLFFLAALALEVEKEHLQPVKDKWCDSRKNSPLNSYYTVVQARTKKALSLPMDPCVISSRSLGLNWPLNAE